LGGDLEPHFRHPFMVFTVKKTSVLLPVAVADGFWLDIGGFG
jgi:hypothetical protein